LIFMIFFVQRKMSEIFLPEKSHTKYSPANTNTFYGDLMLNGSPTQFSYVTNFIIALVVITVGSAKMVQFLHFSGLVLSFPVITLLIAVLGGVMSLFLAEIGLYGWRSAPYVVRNFYFALQFYPIMFAVSLIMIIGLYFKELSVLTKANVSSFNLFFWPAIVVVGGSWVIVVITSALTAVSVLNQPELLANTYLALLGTLVVVFAACLFLIGWGSVSIIAAGALQGEKKWEILKVIVLSLCATVFNTGFGLNAVLFWVYTPGFWFQEQSISLISIVILNEMSLVFVPCCCMLMIIFNFRVSVSKEIELSKSGTSSTSSGSTNKSSSSSSSSADPVIEL